MEGVYVLEKYPFYEGGTIIMVSADLEKVKDCFKEIVDLKKEGYGYYIKKYELGKKYSWSDYPDTIIWVEVDYDDKLKIIHNDKLVGELLNV